jgi:hypothetical protein
MRGLTLTGLVGGAANTDLQRVTTRDATTVAPLRRITADTSPAIAGAIGYWPSRHWGFRLHGSFAPTQLEVRDAGDADDGQDGVLSESAQLWTADLALMIRAPVTPGGRLVPYLLIGGGVIGFSADRPGQFAAETGQDVGGGSSIEPAGMIGVGAHVPLQRGGLALTFELTDHIFTTPIRDPVIGATATGDAVDVTNHFRLLTGLTLRLR